MITISELGNIITFLGNTTVGIFNSLDTAYLYSGISVLDVFVAFMFLDIVTWFAMKILSKEGDNI